MTYETILYTVQRGRARITLNRPEKRNALSKQLRSELSDALWTADDDTSVHQVPRHVLDAAAAEAGSTAVRRSGITAGRHVVTGAERGTVAADDDRGSRATCN